MGISLSAQEEEEEQTFQETLEKAQRKGLQNKKRTTLHTYEIWQSSVH
jgi:hypothetical protein